MLFGPYIFWLGPPEATFLVRTFNHMYIILQKLTFN